MYLKSPFFQTVESPNTLPNPARWGCTTDFQFIRLALLLTELPPGILPSLMG